MALLATTVVAAGAAAPATAATAPTTVSAPAAVRSAADDSQSVQSLAVPAAPAARAAPRSADRGTDDVVAELPQTSTDGYRMVGLTWRPSSEDVTAQIRARRSGVWGRWHTLPAQDDTPEPGTRTGTEPWWVDDADGVAARVRTADGQVPDGLRVSLVDPGPNTAVPTPTTPVADAPTTGARTTNGSTTARRTPAQPSILTREQWGADPSLRSTCDSPYEISSMRGLVVHHTAGVNSYSRADAASVVRGIYAYHTGAQNWCDIGYNFLVDKYGTIYEGRKGSIDGQVRGSHAGNWDVNLYATGISLIGNYDKARPTAALEESVARLSAWRLGQYGLPATGHQTYGSYRLNRIAGHRDVYLSGMRPATSTACPGRYAYAWMKADGGLWDRVAAILSGAGDPQPTLPAAVTKTYSRFKDHLGKQVSKDVKDSPLDGLRFVNYARGRIYLHAGKASAIWGMTDDRYRPLQTWVPRLGFPTSSLHPTTSSGTFASFTNGRIYRHSGRTYALWGDVYRQYYARGAGHGVLGLPTTNLQATKAGRHRASFRGGRIYSYSVGTFALWGKVFSTYVARNATRGPLGMPVTSVKQSSIDGLSFATFANGRVYHRSGQTYALSGPVFQRYRSLAAHNGPLGMPVTSVKQSSIDGLSFATFANGRVYRRSGRTYALWGPVFEKYRSLAAHNGPLGMPVTSVKESSIDGLSFATFANGRVYRRLDKTYALWGPVFARYHLLNAHNGLLGRPHSSLRSISTTWKAATFGHGRIFAQGGRTYTSSGAIDRRYAELGGPHGRMGFPRTGVHKIAKGVKMRFAHGWIKQLDGSGKIEVHRL